jgi:alpha-glucosidase
MDYEPGLLNNATEKQFRPIEGLPMSPGTRCHQLAMFIVYDSPMQIFSGNPSQAWLEPAFTEFLAHIPTTWDETRILEAKVADYIVTARRHGDDWFIGGMTDWSPSDLVIPLDFLDAASYSATMYQDGVNADRYAADYKRVDEEVTKSDTVKVHLAPGGGVAVHLERHAN